MFSPEVEEADQIYLLMKEEYRISRNVRLAWFLGKLNQVIWPASKTELVRNTSFESYCGDQTVWTGLLPLVYLPYSVFKLR